MFIGWSFPRWVEIHAGVGFTLETQILLLQSRVRVYTWSLLDVIVVPRLGYGFGEDISRLYEASVMAGLRLRFGHNISFYVMIGPGVAHTELKETKQKKTRFILPFWGGPELRF